ncbi:hypothetical protein ACQJBY_002930 [Aegilops geniculata]
MYHFPLLCCFFNHFSKCTCFHGVRRLGSVAVDMSHVGLGITEAYWEYRLKPCDMVAGILVLLLTPWN